MFESREVGALLLKKYAKSSCYACGLNIGIIVDLGASGTTVSPVQDGFVDLKGVNRSSVGGRLMDAYAIHSILMKRPGMTNVKPHYRLKKVAEDPSGTRDSFTVTIADNKSLKNVHPSYDRLMTLEAGRDFKESISRMADYTLSDTDPKFTNLPAIPYELPDGTPIDVGIERFRCAELLIDPSPIDFRNPNFTDLFSSNWSSSSVVPLQLESLPKVIADSVFRSDPEMQPMLLANIMLTGGGACIDGITDRIKNELETLIYHQMGRGINKIKVTSGGMSERGALCAWLGGSILASLGAFHDMWISRAEYEEFGPNIIDRKCP
jgi:actin-related protein